MAALTVKGCIAVKQILISIFVSNLFCRFDTEEDIAERASALPNVSMSILQ